MGCVLILLSLITPRIVLAVLWLFTGYLHSGYAGVPLYWPILGFIFMPLTTLAYAFAINQGGGVQDIYLVLLIIAILIDLGLMGGGAARTGRRSG